MTMQAQMCTISHFDERCLKKKTIYCQAEKCNKNCRRVQIVAIRIPQWFPVQHVICSSSSQLQTKLWISVTQLPLCIQWLWPDSFKPKTGTLTTTPWETFTPIQLFVSLFLLHFGAHMDGKNPYCSLLGRAAVGVEIPTIISKGMGMGIEIRYLQQPCY